MKENYIIRNETPEDWREVEELTRNAFWNKYVPGCNEHYLAHVMRSHPDFIPELDFVIECGGKIIGSIMYTKAKLTDEQGIQKPVLSFGPISVHPDYQRKGYGRLLIEHSSEKARELGYDLTVIMGDPSNYIPYGFKSCKRYNICLANGAYPSSMLVKELRENSLDGRKWFFTESELYDIDREKAEDYDKHFKSMKKEYRTSQELFYINSHSVMEDE